MEVVTKEYVQTEIGLLPSDWEMRPIGDLLTFVGGSQPDRSCFIFSEKDGYVRLLQIRDYKTDKYITFIPSHLARRFCHEDDIMIGRYGPPIFQILRGLKGAYNVALIKAIPSNIADKQFCWYVLNQETLFRFVEKLSQRSSGQTGVDLQELRNYLIPFPSDKSEQKAIAAALSDADALITSLEKLIVKKRNIKQGALQSLLTGAKRLDKFKNKDGLKKSVLGTIPKDWVSCEFKDVMDGFASGQTPYREVKRYYEGNIPWITSGELNYNVVEDTLEKITHEAVVKTNLKIIPKGTFLFAITGLEAEGTRGSCAITGVEATTNQSCMALYPHKNKLLTEYLYYFYILYGDTLAFKYCQGTKQQSYTGSIAKNLPIHFPPTIEEQAAIVNLLKDIDAEITVLEQKLEKQRQLKQGMMQNLLTGKIRLI